MENVFVLSTSFYDVKNNIDYTIIKGVYQEKEAAMEEARKCIESQQRVWKSEIEVVKHIKDVCKVFRLDGPSGTHKTWTVKRMPLK